MIDIKIKGLTELKKKLQDKQRMLRAEVDAVLKDGAQMFVELASKDAPVDQSILRQGITFYKKRDLVYTVASNANYSVFVEFGTRSRYRPIPGVTPEYKKGKSANTLYSAIKAWVKRKGIDEAATYPIFLSILKNGIYPSPFFFKQKKPVMNFIDARIKAIL